MKSTYRPTNSNLPAIWQAGMFTNRPYESRKSGTAVLGFINYSFDLEALDRLNKPARRTAGGYQERKVSNPDFIGKP